MMPTSTLFIVFSFLLRTVEGVGTAMYSTVSYTVLTQFYPDKKGTVVVSALLVILEDSFLKERVCSQEWLVLQVNNTQKNVPVAALCKKKSHESSQIN